MLKPTPGLLAAVLTILFAGTSAVSTVELDPWGGNTNRSNNDAFQPRKFTTYERDGNASDEAMHFLNQACPQ
jgi:hypothetical protein